MRNKLIFLIISFFFLVSTPLTASAYTTLSKGDVPENQIESAQKAILLFWTTWCPYCRVAIKELGDMYSDLEEKDYQVYMVNLGEDPSKVEKVVKTLGIKYPVILDRDRKMAIKYRVLGIPTYIFIKNGSVLGRTGYIDMDILDKIYE